jgi:hypothetical protein
MDVMLVLITDMVQFLLVGEPLGTDSWPGADDLQRRCRTDKANIGDPICRL